MIHLDRITMSFRKGGQRNTILRDASFTLPECRGLALIGRNGAGKSTLLRLIAGTLNPDSGRVITDEKISWPMGFSGGFHPALTGAQNARFVARLYGKDPAATAEFVGEFAELGRSFRQPVEIYSAGMKARLAFAISIGMDFDCYLVDEIIGVGDAAFRRKCQQAFRNRLRNARLIMVSHNPQALMEFCDAGLVLEGGNLWFHTSVDSALRAHADHLSTPVPA